MQCEYAGYVGQVAWEGSDHEGHKDIKTRRRDWNYRERKSDDVSDESPPRRYGPGNESDLCRTVPPVDTAGPWGQTVVTQAFSSMSSRLMRFSLTGSGDGSSMTVLAAEKSSCALSLPVAACISRVKRRAMLDGSG